ncbi:MULTISPECIES: reverse transcriptase family protein [Flavobacterium]|uniref:RNA-directed DNA polymerase n=1 Tax=Flavobacterium hankyongi TaxID=1176532 RepID=A0ABP8ZVK8_9FLAO|nr:reverse transcriptase family protein [Flavobacterium sp. N1846]
MSIKTVKHLAFVLKISPQDLLQLAKTVDNFYYTINEPKLDKDNNPKFKNGNQLFRTLNPSTKNLKIIQSRIQRNIISKIELPDYAYGAVKGRDNVKNALKHRGKKYNFTTDLSNYFPSITNRQVYNMFVENNFSPTVARVLTQLTTYNGKLPQGAPTSPTISNLVFVKTGMKLQAIANNQNLIFTSFIDDLTFSSKTDFKELIPELIQIVLNDNFIISHQKTFYKTYRPTVTGVIVTNNYLLLTEKFKKKLSDLENKTPEQILGLKNYALKIKKANSK